jgi:putative SOS response-associated peptidase YedK
MCGRYTLQTPSPALADLFQLPLFPDQPPRYNIAPTQPVAIVRRASSGDGREAALLRWGLIPGWANDPTIGNRLINARAETVAEKPSFRSAFAQRRCLVPADGFYEWQTQKGKKQPFYFRLRSGGPFAFAGLWERWAGEEEIIESCSLLTTEANELVRPVHERMPVVLAVVEHERWLDPQPQPPGSLQALLRPYPAAEMVADPVGFRVNNPRNDDPTCVTPAGGLAG